VIAFRQVDGRYPFLWEDAAQPAGRWHADGEGPAHYFADTPDGAWAEFLRHEEITDADDLATIRRQMWAVEIGGDVAEPVEVPIEMATGGLETYADCQHAARAMRDRGATRISAVSAALVPGGARAVRVDDGLRVDAPTDGHTIVVFGSPAHLRGWLAAADGHPAPELLARVRHFPKLSTRAAVK
jgi:RES domain-containing protein